MKRFLALLAAVTVLAGSGGAAWYPGDVTTGGDVSAANATYSGAVALSGIGADAAPASYVTATYTAELNTNANIVFTAVEDDTWGGALGNSLSITITDPGAARGTTDITEANTTTGAVTVTVSSTDAPAINATGQDIIDAIAANATAAAMMTATNATGSDGTGTATALSVQSLAGGVNGTVGTTGELRYYDGDLFYLRSGSEFYDATWAQWDGADTDGTSTSSRSFTTTATVTAEQLTSTDDATIADTLTADDLVSVKDTTVGGDLDVDGATTLDGLTVAETATFTGPIVQTPIVKDADYTVLDTDGTIFHVGNTAANQTITMPTAAANAGKFFMISVTTDPGDFYVIIDGEGDETVGGAATKTCTDAVGSFYLIYCDGLAWRLVSSLGTWS